MLFFLSRSQYFTLSVQKTETDRIDIDTLFEVLVDTLQILFIDKLLEPSVFQKQMDDNTGLKSSVFTAHV